LTAPPEDHPVKSVEAPEDESSVFDQQKKS